MRKLFGKSTAFLSADIQMYDQESFYKAFESVESDEEAWAIVVDWYKRHYGSVTKYEDWSGKEHVGSWVDILQTYVNVVHMQRWENDVIDVRKVLKQYKLLEDK